jgi:hypothetical protein
MIISAKNPNLEKIREPVKTSPVKDRLNRESKVCFLEPAWKGVGEEGGPNVQSTTLQGCFYTQTFKGDISVSSPPLPA